MGAPAAMRSWKARLTIALALMAFAYLWLQAGLMSGSSLAGADAAVFAVLTQTHYGVAWPVGFIGALLVALSCLPDRRGLPLFAAGLVAWAASKAAASQAADAGDFLAREATHVVHLCATALWAGSVIVAAAVPRRSPPELRRNSFDQTEQVRGDASLSGVADRLRLFPRTNNCV